MRVVLAALSMPVHLNGVSRHAANVANGLLKCQAVSAVHVLAGAWQEQIFRDSIVGEAGRLHIHPVSIGAGTFSRNYWYYTELPRIASQLDADVVHLAYPVPLLRAAFGCPVVVSLHDLYAFDIPGNFGMLKGAFNRLIVRRCLRSASAVACVSESTRERLKQVLGPGLEEKTVTVPNAVQMDPIVRTKGPKSLPSGTPFILCVAQHRRNKNIGLAIRVFERALRIGAIPTRSLLVVVGVGGPETARIERQIRDLRLDRRVVLLRGISDSELQWCYRNCEVLLAPSIVEGFGLPVAEGLVAGARVVCSDIPPFREAGGSKCSYVSLGRDEVEDFVKAIRNALESPRKAPCAMPWLSLEVIGAKYIMLYQSLLCSPASRELGAPRRSQI